MSLFNDNSTCSHLDTCGDLELLFIGGDGITSLEACCVFGGGYPTGKNLLMSPASPIRCAPQNVTSHVIKCACTIEGTRYDISSSSCVYTCGSGLRWNDIDSDAYDNIESRVGKCVACSAGTFSVAANDWIDNCLSCSAGTYTDKGGTSSCLGCPRGTYSVTNGSSTYGVRALSSRIPTLSKIAQTQESCHSLELPQNYSLFR